MSGLNELPPGFELVPPPATLGPNDPPPGFELVPSDGAPNVPMNDPTMANDQAMRTPLGDKSFAQSGMDLISTIMGIADQGARGVAKGVVSIPALPNSLGKIATGVSGWAAKQLGADPGMVDPAVEAYNAGINTVWPIQADKVENALDTANNTTADLFGAQHPRTEPNNLVERAVSKVGEFVGGAAVPMTGALAGAENMGLSAIRQMKPGFLKNTLETAAVDPAKYIANEMTTNTAAGLGAATANEFIDPNTTAGKVAELLTSLGAVGATGLTRVAANGVKTVVNAYRGDPAYASEVVRDNVASRLMSNSEVMAKLIDPADPYKAIDNQVLVDAILNPQQKIGDVIPGFQPTTADVAGDRQLASLEASRAKGGNTGMFMQRADDNAQAVDAAFNKFAPTEQPGAYRDAAAIERDRQMQEAIMGQQASQDAATAALGPLTPTTNAAQRGNTIRTGLQNAEDVARRNVEDRYGALDLGGRMVDPSPLPTSIDALNAGLSPTERSIAPSGLVERTVGLGRVDSAPTPTGILDASGNPIMRPPEAPAQIPLKYANDLRSELGRMASAARADWRAERGGNNAARVISQYQDQVDSFIGQNLTPEERVSLAEAKDQLRQMKDDFTRQGDPIAGVLARNDGGSPKVRDENVAGKLTGSPEMDRLFRYADTPDVRAAMRDEILSRGDFSSPERIAAFNSRYSDQLTRFPGLADELQTAASAQNTAAEAMARRQQTERDLGTDTTKGRSTVAKYLEYSNDNAEKAISDVIGSKDQRAATDELMSFVGNEPQAVEGLRAAFWKKMDREVRPTQSGTTSVDRPVAGRALMAFLDDPGRRAVAERLYRDNPEHLANLRKLGEALRRVNTGKTVGTSVNASGSGLALRGASITAAEVGSKIYQANIGRASYAYIGAYLAGKVVRGMVGRHGEAAFQQLLDEALLKPDVAALLLKENNPANRAALARWTKTWAANEAAQTINFMAKDEEEPDATKAAIMRDK